MDDGSEPAGGHDDSTGATDAALACNCCRRRKLKCSRERPACQQCRKSDTECVYEAKRGKPGMRAGAIDNLHRRLDSLERTVEKHSSQLSKQENAQPGQFGQEKNAYSILSFLAKELHRFNDSSGHVSSNFEQSHGRHQQGPSSKRRRLDSVPEADGYIPNASPSLPDNDTLGIVITAYHSHTHPWIPMVHEGRLRRRLENPDEYLKLRVLFRAMILVASRYIQDNAVALALVGSPEQAESMRDWIVSQATKHPSVENLQALIMIAYNDIGNGEASQAWPLVGLLTRMVEYLQLAVEHDEIKRASLCQPYVSLQPPGDWTETEERRRVFWNVFSLDRFCSVTMGWNTSLTSDDVNRRLPCDGITWRKEDPVTTPYFGIWDKAAGRIGNTIAYLPSHYVAPSQQTDEDASTPSDGGASFGAPSAVDMSTVGAFAYAIEATESLSRITTYFLRQKVNMRDQRDVGSWLTRFKELDLRLVHWKMLLPQKWKVNMARQYTRMDPNLTLAHVTHNASMIILHQLIAYPLIDWDFRAGLPSVCSVDTCQNAATEISTIAENYLKTAPPTLPVSSQFAFCLFIAARVLLIDWRNSARKSLSPEFWSLVRCLNNIAHLWAGPHGLRSDQDNLAAKYSQKLAELHNICKNNELFRIDVLAYTTEINHSNSRTPQATAAQQQSAKQQDRAVNPLANNIDPSSAEANPPPATQIVPPIQVAPTPGSVQLPSPATAEPRQLGAIPRHHSLHNANFETGDFGTISQMLLGEQFMDLDRVITYGDGIFGSEFDSIGW